MIALLGITGLCSCDSFRDEEPTMYVLLTVDQRTEQPVDYPEIPDSLKTNEVPTIIAVHRVPLGGAGNTLAGYTILSAARLHLSKGSMAIEVDLTYTSLLQPQSPKSCTTHLSGAYSVEGTKRQFRQAEVEITEGGALLLAELEVADCNFDGLHRPRGLTFIASVPAK
jgi:hypothetical protein